MSNCSVCEHPGRREIEAALAHGTTRDTAGRFGLSRSTLSRHRQHSAIQSQHNGVVKSPPSSLAAQARGLEKVLAAAIIKGELIDLRIVIRDLTHIVAQLLEDKP